MNIFVLIKQVPDTETKIRLTANKGDIEKTDIKWIISPYDEFAIEEALRTKEKLKEGTVTVLSAGPDRVIEALRTALAMGADNAIHAKIESDALDTFLISKSLYEVLKREKADLIFSGKQAIDDDQAATFGYVAEFLGFPSASVVVTSETSSDKKSIRVHREIDGGTKQILELSIPCVIGFTKGLKSPRYASLPGIMKAKKKDIKSYTLSDLGLTSESALCKDSDYQLPPERQAGKKIVGDPSTQVKELVRLLREESKVL